MVGSYLAYFNDAVLHGLRNILGIALMKLALSPLTFCYEMIGTVMVVVCTVTIVHNMVTYSQNIKKLVSG